MIHPRTLLWRAVATGEFLIAGGLPSQDLPHSAAAQNSALSSIVGIAVDSLHGRALEGAEILLTGPKRATRITDARGIFRFDSVPVGRYELGAFHPLLDTLGLSLATEAFLVRADTPSVVTLAIPSPGRFSQMKCGAKKALEGSSAVIGRLTDAGTSERVSDAEVLLQWTEYTISKETGIRAKPHFLRDITDSRGQYSFCGLPNPIQAYLEARKGREHTASVRVETAGETPGVIVRNLLLPREGVASPTIDGRITNSEGQPLGAVLVQILGTDAETRTGQDGEFSLARVPAGTRALVARQVGYAADTVAVDVEPNRTIRVLVSLRKAAAVIDTVLVLAQSSRRLDQVGFNERRARGDGQYVTAEEIEKRNPSRLTDVLYGKRGIQIYHGIASNTRGLTTVMTSIPIPKNYCIGVQVFIDAVPMPIPFDLDQVSPRSIAGIEVYSGAATVPSVLRGGNTTCGVIALWTR